MVLMLLFTVIPADNGQFLWTLSARQASTQTDSYFAAPLKSTITHIAQEYD